MQNNLLLGIPIVFDTDREDIQVGDKLLITYKGQNIGTLAVDCKWIPDKVTWQAPPSGSEHTI